MVFEFKLPDVGEGIHEGEIVKWHVKPGDVVKEDQLIVEVMTDKATVEITSPKAGRIGEQRYKEGQVAKVGDVIVTIEEGAGGKPPAKAAPAASTHEAPKAEVKEEKTLFELPKELGGVNPFKKQGGPAPAKAPEPVAARASQAGPVTHPAGKPIAAPAVRRKAREMGLDLVNVRGSGPAGRILHQDLAAGAVNGGATQTTTQRPAAPTTSFAPVSITPQGPVEIVPMKGLRKKIAENMTRAKHVAAHYTYVEEVDATELVKLNESAKELAKARGVKLTYLPFVFKAAVAALKAYPIVNSSYDETKQELVFKKYYHMGFAAATEEGLIVPVVKNVDKKSIFDIAKEIETLAEKVRIKKAAPDDLSGSTFTITSLGKLGGLLATPIINYPEVAIMGVHGIKDRPVIKNGQIVAGKVMNLSFSFDHRIVDGAIGAQFAATLIKYLEDPKLLLLETA
jgi:pyruvate dehydrogenase E2 component (dihydrolipoamide acetyltransferase)